MERDNVVTLILLEMHMPASLFDSQVHLLIHLV
jgi:hypothetical protein